MLYLKHYNIIINYVIILYFGCMNWKLNFNIIQHHMFRTVLHRSLDKSIFLFFFLKFINSDLSCFKSVFIIRPWIETSKCSIKCQILWQFQYSKFYSTFFKTISSSNSFYFCWCIIFIIFWNILKFTSC